MTQVLEMQLNGIAKNKYLGMGSSTSISYVGISIIRESEKVIIVNSQFSCQQGVGSVTIRNLLNSTGTTHTYVESVHGKSKHQGARLTFST